jgi:hypothetical protein
VGGGEGKAENTPDMEVGGGDEGGVPVELDAVEDNTRRRFWSPRKTLPILAAIDGTDARLPEMDYILHIIKLHVTYPTYSLYSPESASPLHQP